MRTGLAIDPRFGPQKGALPTGHVPPGSHPERPERVAAIVAALEAAGLVGETVPFPVRSATREELLLAHSARYLESLEQAIAPKKTAASTGGAGVAVDAARARGGWLDPDTYFSAGSFETALLAAGCSVDLSRAVLDGALDNGFGLLRPPGHHATADHAMGFCLLNNAAVAAAALARDGARVAVVDFDVHHGNGTQDIFYADPRVLYASTHQSPFYPGSGAVGERGDGKGRGATVNVPLPAGSGDAAFLAAYEQVILPAVERFRPDVVIASAGFDAHVDDPLASLEVTEAGYAQLSRRLLEVSSGRLVALLEGGYHLDAVARSVCAVVSVLLGARPERQPAGPLSDEQTRTIDLARRSLVELPAPAP